MEEFNEPFGNKELKYYFKLSTDFKSDFDNLDNILIDELTSEFIGSYCDLVGQNSNLLEFFGPTMNKWRYEQSSRMVLATKDVEFIRLWNYIIKGRSLKNGAEFNSYTNDYRTGFLTANEYISLKDKIENYFGDVEMIKKKYWTNKEKNESENAIVNSKNNSYFLSTYNPKSSGLEYVLTAISELGYNNKEMVIGIE
jgi:hypothetical protein